MLGASALHVCDDVCNTMFGMNTQNGMNYRWLMPVILKTFSCGYMKTPSVRQTDELTFSMLQAIALTTSSLLLFLCSMGSHDTL